jgi:acetyl-CoA carboxylase carboxyl transferase subunit alpha
VPLAGDRKFAEDEAIVGGLGRFRGRGVVVIGQEKGADTQSRLKHNWGMAKPEGYRKAVRLMETADRFGLPVITLVDTSGAYPGVDAEERGQAEAIARSTDCCLSLGVPLVSLVIGEGGSGGAIAIATGNSVLMLEHAIYSVISPEGAASILWRDAARAKDAAAALKITAQDLKKLGVIDEIIPSRWAAPTASPTRPCRRRRRGGPRPPGAGRRIAGRAAHPAPREVPRHRPRPLRAPRSGAISPPHSAGKDWTS